MDGRDERFAEWMREHLGVLHRISRAFAPPADQHDLLQELMLAVWKAAPSFRGDSAATTFIWRVAHNRALTWRRRESGRIGRDSAVHAEWAAGAGSNGSPDSELLERLYAAIRRLPPLDRSLMLLSLEGVSYREIGALHGMTESNVGVRLNRARGRISTLVEGSDDGL